MVDVVKGYSKFLTVICLAIKISIFIAEVFAMGALCDIEFAMPLIISLSIVVER